MTERISDERLAEIHKRLCSRAELPNDVVTKHDGLTRDEARALVRAEQERRAAEKTCAVSVDHAHCCPRDCEVAAERFAGRRKA